MADQQFDEIPGSSILAFMYNALYNETINSRIRQGGAELDQVLAEFGLTGTPAADAFKNAIQSDKANKQLIKTIAQAMSTEMNENSVTLRQHIW